MGVYPKKKTNFQGNRRPAMTFINEQIKAPNIVIVDGDGNKLGTFNRRAALELAESKGLDLVQMRYEQQTMTSTVKMVDYGKYQYQKQKEEKEKKKTQKNKGMKELKMSYGIGEHDLDLKIKKAEEFLQDGYGVKMMIRLRGREKAYAHTAQTKLMSVVEKLSAYGRSQYNTPKKEAQGYSIILFAKVK